MGTPTEPFSTLHFSADALPERERVAGWRELYGREVLRLEHEPLPDQPFHVDTMLRVWPGLAVASVRSSLQRVGRTRQLVEDGDDGLILQITTCPGVAAQLGRTVAVEAGAGIVLSAADTGHFTFSAPSDSLALRFPRPAGTTRQRSRRSAGAYAAGGYAGAAAAQALSRDPRERAGAACP